MQSFIDTDETNKKYKSRQGTESEQGNEAESSDEGNVFIEEASNTQIIRMNQEVDDSSFEIVH